VDVGVGVIVTVSGGSVIVIVSGGGVIVTVSGGIVVVVAGGVVVPPAQAARSGTMTSSPTANNHFTKR
jgi:hypothetical protein